MCAVADADHAAYVVAVGVGCRGVQASSGGLPRYVKRRMLACITMDGGMGCRTQEMQTALMTWADTAVTAVPACGREGLPGIWTGECCACAWAWGRLGAVAVEGPLRRQTLNL